MNIKPYSTRMIRRIRRRLAALGTGSAYSSPNAQVRAGLLLKDAASSFLPDIGLALSDEQSPGLYWSAAPEIQVPGLSLTGRELVKFELCPVWGGKLSPFQTMLVLELQDIILTCLESLVASADTVLDMSHGNFSRWAVSRMAMHIAGRDDWREPDFWNSHILSSGFFNTRLLTDLERMLTRTYENEAATTSVVLVAASIAEQLRWSKWLVDARELFAGDKCGLHLSDSDTTSFVFDFTGNEFLGLFDTTNLFETHLRGGGSHFRWRVLADRSIDGMVGDTVRVTYAHGRWQLLDYQRIFANFAHAEQTLRGANKAVWELCVHQSRRREGCLVLIADDPAKLISARLCREGELNIVPNRIVEAMGKRTRKTVACSNPAITPKVVLLEQYRGVRFSKIPMSIRSSFARMDGAIVLDGRGVLQGFGVILQPPATGKLIDAGARTTAARAASRYGLALKVSDDGPITAFRNGVQL